VCSLQHCNAKPGTGEEASTTEPSNGTPKDHNVKTGRRACDCCTSREQDKSCAGQESWAKYAE
jgi:hypothetical protein